MKLEIEVDEIAVVCIIITAIVTIIFAASCEKEKIKHPEYWNQSR